jgi:predicted RNase H-like HicB family nuclease
MDELLSNLQDAIQGWLEVANESKKIDLVSKVVEITV